jgi:hypothetical protein
MAVEPKKKKDISHGWRVKVSPSIIKAGTRWR